MHHLVRRKHLTGQASYLSGASGAFLALAAQQREVPASSYRLIHHIAIKHVTSVLTG
jgi:hypothetical protein